MWGAVQPLEAQDFVRKMRPGDRQGSGTRAVRGDCPSRLEGALPRVRAASQEDGPAREQLGAQLRFGHHPAGPRCGFAQVPGPGAGQQGSRAGVATRLYTLCLGPPLRFQSLAVRGLGAGTQTSRHQTWARRQLRVWGQGAEAPGKGVRDSGLRTARGSAAIGRLGFSQVPGPARAGSPELSRAGDARLGRGPAGFGSRRGALLGGGGRSGTIAAPALGTLLPETVRDEETESRLGLQ